MHITELTQIYKITGESARIEIPDSNMAWGYTFEAWLYFEDPSERPILRLQAANIAYSWVLNVDNRFVFLVERAGADQNAEHDFDQQIMLGQWNHIAFSVALKDLPGLASPTSPLTSTIVATLYLNGSALPTAKIQQPELTVDPENELSCILFGWDQANPFNGNLASAFLWHEMTPVEKIRIRRENLRTQNSPRKLFAAYHNPDDTPHVFPQTAFSTNLPETVQLETPLLPKGKSTTGAQQIEIQLSQMRNAVLHQAEQMAHEKRQQAYKQRSTERLAQLRKLIQETNKANYEYIGFIESGRLKKLEGDTVSDLSLSEGKLLENLVTEQTGRPFGICQDEIDGYLLIYSGRHVFVFDPEVPDQPIAEWNENENILDLYFVQYDRVARWLVSVFESHILVREIDSGLGPKAFDGNGRRTGAG